jgi:hypothetical protein
MALDSVFEIKRAYAHAMYHGDLRRGGKPKDIRLTFQHVSGKCAVKLRLLRNERVCSASI